MKLRNLFARQLCLALSALTLVCGAISCTPQDEPEDPNNGGGTEKPNPEDPEEPDEHGDTFWDSFGEEKNEIKYEATAEMTFDRQIYVSNIEGDDTNDGKTAETPIATIYQLNKMINEGCRGTEIMLQGGTSYLSSIVLSNIADNGDKWIRIGSYGEGKAIIDAAGKQAAIMIRTTSKVYISDLKIKADGGERVSNERCGIKIEVNGCNKEDITIFNVDMRDIYFYDKTSTDIPDARPCREWDTANETNYGWGLKVKTSTSGAFADLKNLTVKDCNFRDISHTAIKMNGSWRNEETESTITNLVVEGCNSYDTGGPAAQFSEVQNGIMRGCQLINPGNRNDARKWGRGSGMWLYNCDGFLFERNFMEGSEGIADCCGAHIDIRNKNVIIQYCLSKNNAGGFAEVLGHNYNCIYRYNISINDGWRNLEDSKQYALWQWTSSRKIGAQGCLITINGHNNQGVFAGPTNTYVYNNTIICSRTNKDGYTNPFVFDLATSAQGIFLANNIFWVEGRMTNSWSQHTYSNGQFINNAYDFRIADELRNNKAYVRDMTQDEIDALNFNVKNNLYKLFRSADPNAKNCLPKAAQGSKNSYWDEQGLGGDPSFANAQGEAAEDFIPSNAEAINKGIEITPLDGDSFFTSSNLDVTEDFFGNAISTPIVGACVAK